MHGLLFTLYVLLSSTHVLCTFSNICQHFCEILEIVKPFFFFLALPALFFPLISLCICLFAVPPICPLMLDHRLWWEIEGCSVLWVVLVITACCQGAGGLLWQNKQCATTPMSCSIANGQRGDYSAAAACRAVCVLGGLMRWKDWQ